MAGRSLDATFYAQIEPEWFSSVDRDGNRQPRAAKVARITQKRPEAQRGGTVLVKLTIRVPVAAFLPLRPAAVVVIPEDMAITEPIQVAAEDPADGAS